MLEEDMTLEAADFPMEELPAVLEALLFVNGDAIALEDIAKALALSPIALQNAADMLAGRYETMPGGLTLQRFGDKVQLSTRKAYHEYIERVFAPKQLQTLSTSMLETLSIIAYKQPITRLEIEDIRGVKCDYSMSALLHRGMIEARGRKDTLGRPMLYGTTDAFLRTFELSSLDELPHAEQLNGYGNADEQEEMTI